MVGIIQHIAVRGFGLADNIAALDKAVNFYVTLLVSDFILANDSAFASTNLEHGALQAEAGFSINFAQPQIAQRVIFENQALDPT